MSYKSRRDSFILKTHKSGTKLIILGIVIAIIGSQAATHINSPIIKIIGSTVDVAGLIIIIDGIIVGIRNKSNKNKSKNTKIGTS